MRDFVPVRRVGWDRWLARRLSRCGARDSRFRCQLHRQPDDTSNAPSVVLTMRASRAEERISDSFAPAKPVPVLKSRSGPLRMPPPAFSLDAATQNRNRLRWREAVRDPSLRSRCSLRSATVLKVKAGAPGSAVTKHRVEDDQQFAGAGDVRKLFAFSAL